MVRWRGHRCLSLLPGGDICRPKSWKRCRNAMRVATPFHVFTHGNTYGSEGLSPLVPVLLHVWFSMQHEIEIRRSPWQAGLHTAQQHEIGVAPMGP